MSQGLALLAELGAISVLVTALRRSPVGATGELGRNLLFPEYCQLKRKSPNLSPNSYSKPGDENQTRMRTSLTPPFGRQGIATSMKAAWVT